VSETPTSSEREREREREREINKPGSKTNASHVINEHADAEQTVQIKLFFQTEPNRNLNRNQPNLKR